MFENLIGQQKTAQILREELERSILPHALLFHGPVYSGKLTAALEVARVLTCSDERKSWGCRCRECEQHRRLIYPGMLLLGPRYFREEILASADALRRSRSLASRYLFIRAVRKLLKRCDRTLWETAESRLKPVLPLVVEAEEELDRLSPDREAPEGKALTTLIEGMAKRCGTIAQAVQQDNIPIDHVRRLTAWSHLSSSTDRKIVVMENIDRMQESSRNALLKILEEPPKDVYFILTTTRKSLVGKTILSRLRPYTFADREPDLQKQVLRQIFKDEESEYESLREYFLAWKELNPHGLKSQARTFLQKVESAEDWMPMDDMEEIMTGTSARGRSSPEDTLTVFGEELLLLLRSRLNEGTGAEIWRLGVWADLIQRSIRSMHELHLQPRLVLESLYFRMRETA